MSLQAVELRSADEVRAHALHVARRIAASRITSPTLESVKAERDEYRALVSELLTKNQALFEQLKEATSEDFVAAPTANSGHLKITVERVIKAACHHYQIGKADLLSQRRTKDVVVPRQTAIYLCRKLTDRSLPEIGRRFAGRDHTTVIHAVRRTESRIGHVAVVDDAIRAIVDLVRS